MKRSGLISLSLLSAVLLSLPWLNIVPGWILFIALVPLLIVEDQLLRRKEYYVGTVFWNYAFASFFLWNILTCWWIVYATPIGAFAVVFLNAFFMAIIWWLFHLFRRKYRLRLAYLALVTVWLSFEYIHYHWDIEWPWLNLGNGFANQVKMVQWYEYTGVLGGSFWVLIVNILLFEACKYFLEEKRKKSVRQFVISLFVVLFPVLVSISIYSNYEENGKAVELVVLQPNIDPYTEKFGSMSAEEQLEKLVFLAESLVDDSTSYLLAPETAIPSIWENEQMRSHPYLSFFDKLLDEYPQLHIVVGATTRKRFLKDEEKTETARESYEGDYFFDIYNSALQISTEADVQVYHKSILVTGVEKIPFRKYFSFFENLILDLGGPVGSLGSQAEPSVFYGKDSIVVAPVICYESVFGSYLSEYIKKGAGLVFILTNDGWWKDSPGYKQHFSFARLRAIEARRSIARSANTGISGLINQRGDVLQKTDWWSETAIKGKIKINKEETFYTQYGDFVGRISSFIAILLLLLFFGKGYSKKRNPH